ncbi:MAG: hypothetical protein COY69_03555 [Candidatus Magasanikbacteria bacterium CG_4_10_14_0_8_um_filter_32_14]|uniref:Uncharacterized protein n=2 Tax=Candidatus Magasanikiibacteriota TaxID=1752731 RepID=A0A2M7R992_9BACT|nr:MAG: hypothetical protein AUJ23_01335 [Candidatus Magasanikbacteria bacterium CG1_02_32_51]PIY93072.1 MAG: hypothetical protein COY69_03555 [Candidatus Magasanikbacteria bacterium CG_4_10_14_0_8_um_filter_32_14]
MSDKKKKIDFVLLVFGSIALFVIIAVFIILYLLFNKDNKSKNNSLIKQNVDLNPTITLQELSDNYKKDIETQINFIKNTDKDIATLSQDLENNMLKIHVPTEEREKFLNVTLQLVRMQKQGLEIDPKASKDKILELLNSLLNYEEK